MNYFRRFFADAIDIYYELITRKSIDICIETSLTKIMKLTYAPFMKRIS